MEQAGIQELDGKAVLWMKNIDERLEIQAQTIREQQKEINTLRCDMERANGSIQALSRMYALILSYAEKKREETSNKAEYFGLLVHLEAFGNLLDRAAEDMENSFAMAVEVIL